MPSCPVGDFSYREIRTFVLYYNIGRKSEGSAGPWGRNENHGTWPQILAGPGGALQQPRVAGLGGKLVSGRVTMHTWYRVVPLA